MAEKKSKKSKEAVKKAPVAKSKAVAKAATTSKGKAKVIKQTPKVKEKPAAKSKVTPKAKVTAKKEAIPAKKVTSKVEAKPAKKVASKAKAVPEVKAKPVAKTKPVVKATKAAKKEVKASKKEILKPDSFFNVSSDGIVTYPKDVKPADFDLGILRRRKHSRFHAWKSVAAYCLGGLVAVITPLVTFSVVTSSVSAGDVLTLAKEIGIVEDPSQILTAEYQEKSLLSIAFEVSDSEKTPLKNINDINKITPLVESKLITPLLTNLKQYAIEVDATELYQTDWSQIPNFFVNTLANTSLPALLGSFIGGEIDLDNNPIMQRILYESYPDVGRTIKGLVNMDFKEEVLEKTTVGEALGMTEAEGFMGALLDSKLTAEDISDHVNNMSLKNLIPNIEENRILKSLADSNIKTLADDINGLTFVNVFSDEIYEADGKTLLPTWKYLLTEPGEHGVVDGIDKSSEYKIVDMDQMVGNVQENMVKASVQQLSDDGFMDADSEVLSRKLPSGFVEKFSLEKETVGDLTSSELVSYVDWLTEQLENM